jgi:hypothetical protein
MEENNFINDEQPVVAEQVSEAPMPTTESEPVVESVEEPKPEISAWEKYKVTAAEEAKDSGVISTDNLAPSTLVQGMGSVANGVIGATQVERTPEKPAAPQKKTVAIHSTKNVSLPGVGKVYRGYNIVTPDQAEAWLKRSHIRLATPEEVAKEFGR